jgi:hypothetical protein
MAATTYLANPVVTVGASSGSATDISDQCISAVFTQNYDQLDSTAFGQTNRTYTKGLSDVSLTLTFLTSYASSETYALLQPLLGAAATYVSVKPTSAADSATNPKFELTNGFLASMDYVNASLGELSQLQVVFTGGSVTIDTSA